MGNGGSNGGTSLAVNPTTGNVFVPNSLAGTLTILDGPTMLPLETRMIGDDPGPVAVDASIGWVYVGIRGIGTLKALPDSY